MKKCFFLFLFSSVIWVYAQSDKKVENGLFKVNALLPGVSYELGIAETSTLNFEAIIGFAINGGSDRDTEFGIYPGLQAEYRNYVNMDRRLRKNKNISGNSGNYISFLNQFQFGTPLIGDLEYTTDYFYNVAAVYGIQRTRPKGFYWGVSFGPAIFIDDFSTDPGILVDARLGWVIGGRKK